MERIFAIFSIIVSLGVMYYALKNAKKLVARGMFFAVGTVLGIVASAFLFGPVYEWVGSRFVGLNTIWGIAAFTVIFIIVATSLTQGVIILLGLESGVKKTMIWLTSAILSGGWFIAVLDANLPMSIYFNLIGGLIVLVLAVSMTVYWRSGLQDKFALEIGYIGDIVLFLTLIWWWTGINIFDDMTATFTTVVIFVGFNCCIIVYDTIISKKKPYNEKFATKVIYIWAILMSFVYLGSLGLQLGGYVNHHELAALRLKNKAERAKTTLVRNFSFGTVRGGYTLVGAKDALKKAIEKNDLAGIERANASLDLHLEAQRQIENADLEYANAISPFIKDVKTVFGKVIVFRRNGSSSVTTIFLRTFTEADADADGWIEVLNWGQVNEKINDNLIVEIDEKYANEKDLISFYKGDGFSPSLIPIIGYHSHPIIQKPLDNSYFYLRLKKGGKIKGKVCITGPRA